MEWITFFTIFTQVSIVLFMSLVMIIGVSSVIVGLKDIIEQRKEDKNT